MEKYFLLAFTILFFSCKKDDNVEIYLLKERKENKFGVEISKLKEYSKREGYEFKNFGEYTTIDTINKKILFASDFDFLANDLEAKPFITNDEILKLDTIKGKIEFSNSGGRKLLGLKPNLRNGKQFIITVNKNPVFSGYVWSPYSSNGANWFCIQYEDTQTAKDTTLNNYKFLFYKGLGTSDPKKREKIDFEKYPELLEAFKESDRLKEDKNN
jgi:hypothetical protein